ncbi:hypothetical protein GCM10010278_35080 [Streptomyces melanogenes]|nr:hypothetical protein GCM10010278_35080 [Streptomyces melanogenes]
MNIAEILNATSGPRGWVGRPVGGKATGDEDVLGKFDGSGGVGDSMGHRSATEHAASEVSQ